MLRSMTSYGAGVASGDTLDVSIEVKSVNHRFLDTKIRLPKDYLSLESKIVSRVKGVFARGRVEIFVQINPRLEQDRKVQVNLPLARAYYDAMKELVLGLSISGPINIKEIMDQPGVLEVSEDTRNIDDDWPVIDEALKKALAAATTMRELEGKALEVDLDGRFAKIRTLRDEIHTATDGAVDRYRAALLERVQGVLARLEQGKIDEGRLLQEVTHLTDRSDITEELTRLNSHLDQCDALKDEAKPVGRRLDFLNQELLREANTIMSKCTDAQVSRLALEIKVELEKVREQAQNIE